MPREKPVFITAAVEGNVDEAVVRRLIEHVGGIPGPVYGRNGKDHLRQRIANYNQAARLSPWVVLVDLDHDAECAPPLRSAGYPRCHLICACASPCAKWKHGCWQTENI